MRRRTSSTRFARRSWRAVRSRATTGAGARNRGKMLPAPPAGVAAGRSLPQPARAASSPGTTRSRAASRSPTPSSTTSIIARSDGTPTYNFCVVVDDIGHAHHARDPRRRPRQQHAAPDQHDPRAWRHRAGLRSPADRARRRRATSCRSGTARSACCSTATTAICPEAVRQLPGAPGLGARRREDVLARGVRRLVRPGAICPPRRRGSIRTSCSGSITSTSKRLPADELGRRLIPLLERAGPRRRGRPGACERRRAVPRPRCHPGGNGRCRALLLRRPDARDKRPDQVRRA